MPERMSPDIEKYIEKEIRIEKIPLPTRETMPRELLEVTDKLSTLTSGWNPVEIYQVDMANKEKERSKVIEAYEAGGEYNPQFTYSYAEGMDIVEQEKQLPELLKEVRAFKPTNRQERLGRVAVWAKLKDDLSTMELVQGIQKKDDKLVGKALKQKYAGTDASLVAEAQAVFERLKAKSLGQEPKVEKKELPPPVLSVDEIKFLKELKLTDEEQAEAMTWLLTEYGIQRSEDNPGGFQVVVSPEVSAMDVRDKSKLGPTVFLPKDRTRTAYQLLYLLAHEIGGHARQAMNGQKLFKLGGGGLKIDDETLYEGLAMHYEAEVKAEMFGEQSEPLPYAVLAIADAEKGDSFFEMWKKNVELRKTTGATNMTAVYNDAFATVLRAMRGHVDMSNKEGFAMSKDLAYLRGRMQDEELRSRGYRVNETAVIGRGGLQMLAEFHIEDKDLIPYELKGPDDKPMQPAMKYWLTFLKPRMES